MAEEQAMAYLIDQGLKVVTTNYWCRLGEIDLIMLDKEQLVFVEVRARISAQFGDGIASITATKKQKIMKSALHYIQKNREQQKRQLRFDVVSIDGQAGCITWLKDAFGADY